ncbi:MAG: hypothetical protein QOG54_2547 [Actinomycetota bacterium]|jgi:hypothetical protein|nr:hypothetical protein [Actinomycetota bacterium]
MDTGGTHSSIAGNGFSNGNHNGDGRRIEQEDSHDLRDALAVTKGWLEVLFRHWNEMNDEERFQLVAGALLGANTLAQKLDVLDGLPIDLTDPPHERMAEEFLRLERWPGPS